MLDNIQMVDNCSECGFSYPLDIEHRPIDGDISDVGHECPQCHTWYHSYYLSQKLEAQRILLDKFKSKANRSDKDWQRYRRKKREYQDSFDRFQARVKGLQRRLDGQPVGG